MTSRNVRPQNQGLVAYSVQADEMFACQSDKTSDSRSVEKSDSLQNLLYIEAS